MNADDPIMQQLRSFLSAQQAKNDDPEKRLAASEEKARISQMVVIPRSVVFRLSITIVIKWLMYETIILPHITDRSTHV